MAFRRKRELVLSLRPDILILQEVARRDLDDIAGASRHWVGSNPHKGLAIVVFGDREVTVADHDTGDLPWFIPLRIADPDLQVVAV